MRVYDPRVGKFLSVDPLTKKYSELTPYQFASNSPILGIDFDGLEFYNSSSSKVSIALTYDAKLKQVTQFSTYFRRENIPDALEDAIDRANTNPQALGSTRGEVKSFSLNTPFSKKASDAQMDDANVDKTSVGASTYGTAIIPKNKAEARAQELSGKYFTEGVEPAIGKANAVYAAIDLLTSVLKYIGDEHVKAVVATARNQSLNGAVATIAIIQDAVNSGKLAGHLDQGSLIGLSNYLLYGAEIDKTQTVNGENTLVQDVELTKIAKQLWTEYKTSLDAKKKQEELKQQARSKVDDVGVNKNN